LIIFLLNNFDDIFVKSEAYSNIINLLEKSNNIYKKFNEDTFDFISSIGKTSNSILENSDIINNIKLRLFNEWDFNIYSLLAPKFYNLTNLQLNGGIGINKFQLTGFNIMLTQTKDIYTSYNKISDALTNYLKNVSTTLIDQLTYISSNSKFTNLLNFNQYKEKYDYKYKLENEINTNLETITSYTLETLFPIQDSSNNQYYFNNLQMDISNNIATGQNLFEIKDETKIITEYFEQINNDFNSKPYEYKEKGKIIHTTDLLIIETSFGVTITVPDIVAILLNPYQGLKQIPLQLIEDFLLVVAILLNPYQGLKQILHLEYFLIPKSQFFLIPIRD
jgi:hypothetical protein